MRFQDNLYVVEAPVFLFTFLTPRCAVKCDAAFCKQLDWPAIRLENDFASWNSKWRRIQYSLLGGREGALNELQHPPMKTFESMLWTLLLLCSFHHALLYNVMPLSASSWLARQQIGKCCSLVEPKLQEDRIQYSLLPQSPLWSKAKEKADWLPELCAKATMWYSCGSALTTPPVALGSLISNHLTSKARYFLQIVSCSVFESWRRIFQRSSSIPSFCLRPHTAPRILSEPDVKRWCF